MEGIETADSGRSDHLMISSFLKSPRLPISRSASSVGDSDNLDGGLSNPVNQSVRKTAKQKPPRAQRVHRPNLGFALNFMDGVVKFRNKSICGRRIPFSIPLVCCMRLGNRLGMKSNASSGHPIVRGSGGAPPTKALSLLVFDLDRRCDAQFPYPMPLQHPHQLNRPNCPVDARLELREPRAASSTLLSRPFVGWISFLKIIRHHGCRQSPDRHADRPEDVRLISWRRRIG